MAKQGQRKKAKRQIMPPLTLLDRSIYWVGIILTALLALATAPFVINILDMISLSDANVVASEHPYGWLLLLSVLYLFGSLVVFLLVHLSIGTPIIGDKKIRYGEYPFRTDVFPLFSKMRSEKIKRTAMGKRLKVLLILWLIGLFVFLSLAPIAICRKNILYNDYRIEEINGFGARSESYSKWDYKELTIYTSKSTRAGRKGLPLTTYQFGVKIIMDDGASFAFPSRCFSSLVERDRIDASLDKMLEIKALFPPEKIKIEGKERLERLIDTYSLTPNQIARLYDLFDQT